MIFLLYKKTIIDNYFPIIKIVELRDVIPVTLEFDLGSLVLRITGLPYFLKCLNLKYFNQITNPVMFLIKL